MEGVVKFFNPDRHYGIVQLRDENNALVMELFFHGTALKGPVNSRDSVTCFIDDDPRRQGVWVAVDVERVTDVSEREQEQEQGSTVR